MGSTHDGEKAKLPLDLPESNKPISVVCLAHMAPVPSCSLRETTACSHGR